MSKITSRDIQLFVAGALAFIGFGMLLSATLRVCVVPSFVAVLRILSEILLGLPALWIGVAMLRNRLWAVTGAKVYLWITSIICLVGIAMLLWFMQFDPVVGKSRSQTIGYQINAVEILPNLVLLWLLSSKRFNNSDETNSPVS